MIRDPILIYSFQTIDGAPFGAAMTDLAEARAYAAGKGLKLVENTFVFAHGRVIEERGESVVPEIRNGRFPYAADHAHPDADFDCDACGGNGWVVLDYRSDDDGREGLTVQRCDDCMVDTVYDEDVAPYARKAGIDCEAHFPCYVIQGYDN